MKVLSVHDLRPEDSLLLTFNSALDPQAALTDELEPFLEALEKYADGWMPDVVKGKRRRKYSRSSFWKALEEGHDEGNTDLSGSIGRSGPPWTVDLGSGLPPRPARIRPLCSM